MAVATTVDVSLPMRSIRELAKATGKSTRSVALDQLRLMGQDAIKITPPKSRKRGVTTLTADINKLFAPMDSKRALNEYQRAIEEAGQTIYRELHGKSDVAIRPEQVAVSQGESMRATHERFRNKKTGRVSYRRDWSAAWSGRYLVTKQQLSRYVKERVKSVGRLKAGWLPGTLMVSMVAGKTIKYGKWIKSNQEGSATTSTLRPDGNGYAEIVNKVPYASPKLNSLIRLLVKKRERAISSAIKRELKKDVSGFNKAPRDTYRAAA